MEKLCGMLGLAMRAGRVVIGSEQICLSMQKRKGAPALVLISERASENAKKRLTQKSSFYGIRSVAVDIEMEELGRLLGKTYTPAAVAITDEGFAQAILKLCEAEGLQQTTKGSFHSFEEEGNGEVYGKNEDN